VLPPGTEKSATPPTRGAVDPAEADLLAKAQGGNLFAFEEIVKRYQRRVYGTALRILRRHDLADDVVQDTFLKAYQALERFDRQRPFGPWICRIAANLAVNHVRSPESREQELPDGLSDMPAADPGPLGGVLEAEGREVLDRAMDRLSPEQRAVFVLRVFEELSYQEIADALAISPGTVMSRLSRARERLRDALTPYLGVALRRAGGDPA
jgi:RNA polymerase sigma-70 factor (ECF subfamily)